KKAGEKEKTQLSFDGNETELYSSFFEWSPDSKKIAAFKITKRANHVVYFVESSPEDQLQPKLHEREYLKPGDVVPIRKPCLFNIESKKQIAVDATPYLDQYRLLDPQWRKDSKAFTFEYNQRGHQVYQIIEVNASTGDTRVVIDERSDTFIDYSGKHFRYDVNDGAEIVWSSERDGWAHLYLFNGNTGKIKNQITKGEWVIRDIVHVDESNRQILFAASGRNDGEDPYFIHYYKINFDGSGLTELTPEKATHEGTFSADFKYFIDQYSRVDLAPLTVLRNTVDGKVLMQLEQADISDLLKTGWSPPEVFVAKGRDGKTDIWGNIYRPSNFDPQKKYPVIEYIYAGPHNSFAQKSFRAYSGAFTGLSELGFVIVQLDGMGTSNRSKAFHDVCWKNLRDAGFPDRVLWIEAAAEKNSYMDISNMGIFGVSAGGQSSLAGMLWHGDFYKVCVSSCGCHDNRM
ncbi:MAG: DPP IV N-terminal domain-containing protein, partial [Cyclobacteriaceae bacterium]